MRVVRGLGLVLFVLMLVSSVSPVAAKDQPPKATDVPATVIAHVSLPQPTGTQMLLQKENGKHYLYVQQASKQIGRAHV